MKLKLINAEVKIFERLRSRMSVTFPYRIKVSEFSNEILEFQRAVSEWTLCEIATNTEIQIF